MKRSCVVMMVALAAGAMSMVSGASGALGAAGQPGSGAAATPVLPPLGPGDWLMYRDRATHAGWNGVESGLSTGTVGGLEPVFSFAGAGSESPGTLPEQLGAVGHGLLYARGPVGGLSAYDAVTGAVRWTSSAAGTEIALGGDLVYTVTSGGTVDVVSAATGGRRWHVTVPGDWLSVYGEALRPPTLAGGCLLVAGIQRYNVTPGGSRQHSVVDCISTTSRTLRWSSVIGDMDAAIGSVSADKGTVFVETNDRAVSALSLQTGAIRWQISATGGSGTSTPMPSPTVLTDRIVVGFADGSFRAYNRWSGTELWSRQVCNPGVIFASSASADGVDYVECWTYTDTTAPDLFAVSDADGHVIWSLRSNGANSPPTVADGVVYLGTTVGGANGLAAYAAADGVLLGAWTLAGPANTAVSEPIVAHGHVYIGTTNQGTAFALS